MVKKLMSDTINELKKSNLNVMSSTSIDYSQKNTSNIYSANSQTQGQNDIELPQKSINSMSLNLDTLNEPNIQWGIYDITTVQKNHKSSSHRPANAAQIETRGPLLDQSRHFTNMFIKKNKLKNSQKNLSFRHLLSERKGGESQSLRKSDMNL